MSIIKEFREFAMRGNVVDLAVGVIIGAAFGKIVSSLVADIIMPPLGLLIGGIDFKQFAVTLRDAQGDIPAVVMHYGVFIQNVFDFLIVAFAIFMAIKLINKLNRKKEEPAAAPAPTIPAPKPVPTAAAPGIALNAAAPNIADPATLLGCARSSISPIMYPAAPAAPIVATVLKGFFIALLFYKVAKCNNVRIMFEVKPYSLSYHAATLTSCASSPETISVCVGSKTVPCVSPTISVETKPSPL